jgi:hypothetical protein
MVDTFRGQVIGPGFHGVTTADGQIVNGNRTSECPRPVVSRSAFPSTMTAASADVVDDGEPERARTRRGPGGRLVWY